MPIGKCYVCLYNTRSISPCLCQIAVHPKCLQRMRKKMGSARCSVCDEEFSDVVFLRRVHYLKILVVYFVFLNQWLYIFPKR